MKTSEALQQEVGSQLQPWMVGGLLVAAATAGVYRARRAPRAPEQDSPASLLPFCEDIVDVLSSQSEAVIVGGLPIDAVNHPETQIDAQARMITVSSNFASSLRRANGSVRDYDVLTFKRDEDGRLARVENGELEQQQQAIDAAVRARAEQLGHEPPVMSLFSFDHHTSIVHSATLLTDDGRLQLAQGFVTEDLPDSTMQAWQLVLPNGVSVSVLNPWEQYWRSVVRFSSGMKVKDVEKLTRLRERLVSIEGLAQGEHDELSTTYERFHQRMREQNQFATVLEAAKAQDRDCRRVTKLGLYALSSSVLGVGQQSKILERVVQGAPVIFDRFVGSK